MNNHRKEIPWKGLVLLLALLVILSVVAFLLSSVEGFAAGVVLVFMGWLVSFFRDDVKRVLGISSTTKESKSRVSDDEDEYIYKLEKIIAKRRAKIEKTVSRFECEPKVYKRRKIAREIVEHTTALLATVDSAKSYAIQIDCRDLLEHYREIASEIRSIRQKYEVCAAEISDDCATV